MGQMAHRVASSMGKTEEATRPSRSLARTSASVELQLGRLEKEVPEVHEPQEVSSHGPVPQDGQGQQRTYTAERVH